MSTAEIARFNFNLASKFTDFVARHPEVVIDVPEDAQLVFISGSRYLKEYNLKLGKSLCKTGVTVYQAIEKNKTWTLEELVCER